MNTVILRNKRPAKMPLAAIKDLKGKPIVLQPHGYHGHEAIAPSFVQNHPDVMKLVKAGWLEIAPGPSDGEELSAPTEPVAADSPLQSKEALKVPAGDGPVVAADAPPDQPVYLGDPSNPLPPDMNTSADPVEPHAEGLEPQPADQPRARRKRDH